MSVSARPHTKFAAALVAAGVVSGAAVTAIPQHVEPPTISVDVANAAAITSLQGLGTAVTVLDSLVGLHVDATISLPFEASLAVLAAAQHPEVAPNVLSYLVQRFVNPAVGPPIAAYPWETEQTVALFATLLPYPLGPSATDPGLVNQGRFAFADVFNSVLGQLPDPMPGYEAVQDVSNNTAVRRRDRGGPEHRPHAAVRGMDRRGLPRQPARQPGGEPTTPDQLPRIGRQSDPRPAVPGDHAPEAVARRPDIEQDRRWRAAVLGVLRTLAKPIEKRQRGKRLDADRCQLGDPGAGRHGPCRAGRSTAHQGSRSRIG